MKKALLVCFYVLVGSVLLQAQNIQRLLNDNEEEKPMGKFHRYIKDDNFVITIGNVFDNTAAKQPTIYKTDTSGNTIWSYQDITNPGNITSAFKSDSCIYFGTQGLIYRINAHTGQLIWKAASAASEYITDYNNTSIISYYNVGPISTPHYVLTSKATGAIIKDSIAVVSPTLSIADVNQNLYATRGAYLYKIAPDLSTVLWKDTIKVIISPVQTINRIVIDSIGRVFVFSTMDYYEGGVVTRIDPQTGSVLWQNVINETFLQGMVNSISFADAKDRNDSLYVAWNTTYTGGGLFMWQKINKNTGTPFWTDTANLQIPGTSSYGGGAIAIDLDDKNDIYVSGYCGNNNNEGYFQAIKISGRNGATIFSKTIDLDTTTRDFYSTSKGVVVCNNVPYFLGTIDAPEDSTHHFGIGHYIAIAKLNPENGQTIFTKLYGGNSKFLSSTNFIQKYSVNKFVTLSNVGRRVHVAMFDYNLNVIWERYFSNSFFLRGTDLKMLDNKIYIGAYSRYAWNYEFSLLILDSLGNSLDSKFFNHNSSYWNPGDTVYSFKIYPQHDKVLYTFYRKHSSYPTYSGLHIMSYQNGIFSQPQLLQSVSTSTPYNLYSYTDIDTSYLIGIKLFSAPNLVQIDKSNLTESQTATIPLFFLSAYNISKSANNQLLISSTTSSVYPMPLTLLYDMYTNDTIWTSRGMKDSLATNPTGTFCIKTIETNNSVYALDQRHLGGGVRKINKLNGECEWEKILKPDSTYYKYGFTDFTYNAYYAKLVASAYRKKAMAGDTITDLMVYTYDTLGQLIDSLILPATTNQNNNIAQVLSMEDKGTFISGSRENNNGPTSAYIARIEDINLNCNAGFEMHADANIQHQWWALNQTTGNGSISYVWNWGDGSSSTGSNPSHYYSSPGYFNICLTITDSIGCTDTYCDSSTYIYKDEALISVNVVNELPTSVTPVNKQESYARLYPNPSSNQLTIEIDNSLTNSMLTIYNIDGTMLSTTQISNTTHNIQISHLPGGIYIAEIKSSNKLIKLKWIKI